MLLGIFTKKKGEYFDYWTFTIFGAGFSCFVYLFSLSLIHRHFFLLRQDFVLFLHSKKAVKKAEKFIGLPQPHCFNTMV